MKDPEPYCYRDGYKMIKSTGLQTYHDLRAPWNGKPEFPTVLHRVWKCPKCGHSITRD